MRIATIVAFIVFTVLAAQAQESPSAGAATGASRDEAAELLRRHREAMGTSLGRPSVPTSSPLQPAGDVTTNVADSGTNGDVIMSSPSPFTTTGVLLQAKPTWPYVIAKTGSADGYSAFAVFNSSNVEQFRVTGDGRIGIGTNWPLAKLHVFGNEFLLNNMPPDGTTPSTTLLTMANRSASGTEYSWRFATGSAAQNGSIYPNALEVFEYPGVASPCCHRRLTIKPVTVAAPKVFAIDGAGNVGIGVWEPTAALHVAGNARFDGTVTGTLIQAHYQDVAEWVPSDEDLAPGTVVVLDAAVGNGVMASSRAYDTTVAGVISAQPGILLGEPGVSKEQVSTTGRVRVKVDASFGPIAVGDLLVTSDKRGFAMRSTPIDVGSARIHRPGTIVGKALESLQAGEGEILVLLSLQ